MLADSVSGESSLLGSQMATFSVCPHMAEIELSSGVSSYKDRILA